jgi:hypothetical protein
MLKINEMYFVFSRVVNLIVITVLLVSVLTNDWLVIIVLIFVSRLCVLCLQMYMEFGYYIIKFTQVPVIDLLPMYDRKSLHTAG